MALFDDDNQFAGFEEEGETPPVVDAEGEEAETPPPSSNRNFILGISILGGIILLGIIGVVLFAIFGGQNKTSEYDQQLALINAANTATVQASTQVAMTQAAEREFARQTLNAPTVTSSPTPVISFPTETSALTATKVLQTPNPTQVELTRQAEEKAGTSTPTATLSVSAAQTATAVAKTATGNMPGTGFADEVGLPLMIGMAALLLVVIFVARRLRTA
jgi:cytoskeletal protein RodZ